ncbi:MAG: hypothetical protein AWM53_01519 [Candidatus Dichloromethanomonas elyunquensis]|nr:MAG: hypothetical protein AWM53_01519 [Candidatus Dichloromethanomonas elyunquensis]
MINANRKSNRLINEKSPYLLQHAYNPVDWYPWGTEAFEKAKQEDKPIFLSIGYSCCHWCHVMERESFEDEEVAEILSRSYIAIKVDREERPDIDHIYMTYCQALTGAGGWPLTVILTPDRQPFFAGTYFPKHSQYGRPGLLDILNQVTVLWQTGKDKVLESADELYEAVSHQQLERKDKMGWGRTGIPVQAPKEKESVFSWGAEVLRRGYDLLEKSFDTKFGGFGNAPKFPSPHNLGFLLRFSLGETGSQALAMVEKTLDHMAEGGIYDHIGFGFARYSTDRYWLIPHFEKMLYDNAGLAYIYLEAYQLTKKERFGRIAREIFHYVLRDMTSAEGGFYSAEDADSEGEEGKYYVWSKQELKQALANGLQDLAEGKSRTRPKGKEKALLERYAKQQEKLVGLYCEAYGIHEEGNYEGKNIPSKIFSIWEEIAFRHQLKLDQLEELMNFCNEILFAQREQRIRPAKDDKILVSWNGLMIAALAKGAQVFTGKENFSQERDTLLLAAENAVKFILSRMSDRNGRLLARYRDGEAGYLGYVDDYAFLIFGLLEVYAACGKPEYLKQAIRFQEEQERLFRDQENGGYYFTGLDAEDLLVRPKQVYDGAMPSGNSLSALNLVRIWKMTGQPRWQDLVEKQSVFLKTGLQDYAPGYTAALQAIQFYLGESEELVLSGSLHSQTLLDMQKVIFEDFRPFSVLAYNEGTVAEIIPRMKDYPVSEQLSAYYCRSSTCREPVHEARQLRTLLHE